jgi:hypothetical protein
MLAHAEGLSGHGTELSSDCAGGSKTNGLFTSAQLHMLADQIRSLRQVIMAVFLCCSSSAGLREQ